MSVLGAYLAWTLMAAEILYIPAKADDMPRFLARTNSHGAPVAALVHGRRPDFSCCSSLLLFAADALDFMLDLTAALSLIPYLLAAAYAVKLTVTRETYERRQVARRSDTVVAGGGDVLHAVPDLCRGLDKLLLSCILYAPAAALYCQGPPRTRSAGVHPGRGGVVRRHRPRGGRGCGVLATGAIEI